MTSRAARVRWLVGGAAVAALAVGIALYLLSASPVPGVSDLGDAVRDRGRVALVGRADLERLAGGNTDIIVAAGLPAVRAALAGTDPEALARALDAEHLAGLLVDGRHPPKVGPNAPLSARLRRYDYVPGLAGAYLAPAAALYLRHPRVHIDADYRRALAVVARGVLRGEEPPHIASFPEPLRRVQPVEVMVLLREGSEARLWRSARGSSIARALLTAALVARDRWQERQQAMGGPLHRMLPRLAVEVSLLVEDGTLGDRSAAFLDRAITADHGVGYERKGTWRYLLPAQAAGSGARAFQRLFRDNGLAPDALHSSDVRLYRMVVDHLATSAPEVGSGSGSEPGSEGDSDAGAPSAR